MFGRQLFVVFFFFFWKGGEGGEAVPFMAQCNVFIVHCDFDVCSLSKWWSVIKHQNIVCTARKVHTLFVGGLPMNAKPCK